MPTPGKEPGSWKPRKTSMTATVRSLLGGRTVEIAVQHIFEMPQPKLNQTGVKIVKMTVIIRQQGHGKNSCICSSCGNFFS